MVGLGLILPAAFFGAERSLGAGLKQLVLLAESYPQLKADATSATCRRAWSRSRTSFSTRGASTTGR